MKQQGTLRPFMFHHHSGQGVEPHTLPGFRCRNLQHDSGHSLQVWGSFLEANRGTARFPVM